MISLPLKQMSRAEKVAALEALWVDLSRNEAEFEPPDWDREELTAAEERVRSEEEQFVDWETAKKLEVSIYCANDWIWPVLSHSGW
ncbi:MAG: addiction module protein [Verrucomicrobiota bacterium]|jgi:hypothetical protein